MDSLTPLAEETRAEDAPQPPTERERYIDGLRVLASVLERNPDIPLPFDGSRADITIQFLHSDNPREAMAAAARALPSNWRKHFYGSGENAYFDLRGQLGGLRIALASYRDAVCKRVVIGTEEREVDEVVTPAVTKTVKKPVDIVEWDCGSLFAPRPLADEAPKAVEAA